MDAGFAIPALLVPLIIVGGLVTLMVLALVWQRKGLTTQQQAMSSVEESLRLSRRGVDLGEQSQALHAENLKIQREMLQVLHRILKALDAQQSSQTDPDPSLSDSIKPFGSA